MISKKPFFNHAELKKRIEDSRALSHLYAFDVKATAEAFAKGVASLLEPLSFILPNGWRKIEGSRLLGFMVDANGRLVIRIASEEDAALIGAEVASQKEIEAYLHRIMDLPYIEYAALQAQARSVKLAQLLERIVAANVLPAGLAVEAGQVMHQIRQEDTETEAARRAADYRPRHKGEAA